MLTTVVYAALHAQSGSLGSSLRTWALTLGTVAGVATSVHGLADLIEVDRTAHSYVSGDASTRAAVLLAHAATSPIDPRGFATFGLTGVVVFAFARHLRARHRLLGLLGQLLGADLVLLFVASAFGSSVPVLILGGLAAVLLGPAWWFTVAVGLRRLG